MFVAECQIGVRVRKSRTNFGEQQKQAEKVGTVISEPRLVPPTRNVFEVEVQWDDRQRTEWVNLTRLVAVR